MGYQGFIRDLQKRTFFTEGFAAAHPERVQWLADAFWDHRPLLADYLKHVVARQRHDATGILATIGQPTLVIVGSGDTHVGDTGSHVVQSRHLADHIPGAAMVTIPDSSHGLFWEATAPTIGAIGDWLLDANRATRR